MTEVLKVLTPENVADVVLEDLMKEQAKVVTVEGAKLMEKIQEMTQNVKLDDVLEFLKKGGGNGVGEIIEMLKTNGVIKL